jgi:hypothetical protein
MMSYTSCGNKKVHKKTEFDVKIVTNHDDSDEDAEDDVDEKCDECVEVDAGENVYEHAAVWHRAESGKHVVA